MTEPHTRDFELPWRKSSGAPPRPAVHLCIAWSLEEPERIGQTARLDGAASLLGRGEPEDDDPAPRLEFGRASASSSDAAVPLRAARLSRIQALFRAVDARHEIEALGRCPVALNGVPITRARVAVGDTITLRNAMVLHVVERNAGPRRLRVYDPARSADFGKPDFYEILFERYPETESMFPEERRARQRNMLKVALIAVLEHLEDSTWLVKTLEGLGAGHVRYGVTEEMYDWVGESLLATLEEALGGDWTPEVERAWTGAYLAIAGLMQQGARSVLEAPDTDPMQAAPMSA